MKLTEKLAWLFSQWGRRDLSMRAKHVLFVLVERSDADLTCYPSVETIARDCGVSRPTAVRALKELVEMGMIERWPRRRRGASVRDTTIYVLTPGDGGRFRAEPTPVQERTDGRFSDDPTRRFTGEPENPPNGTLPLNPPAAAASRRPARRDPTHEYSADFEEVWGLYPKRDGDNPKKRAWRAWNARLREGTSPEEMIAGIRRYACWVRTHGKEGTETVKQAATFFGPDCAFRENWSVDGKKGATTLPVVTAADLQRELAEENRKVGYRAT